MRQVGERHQQLRPLLLDLIELDAELADLLRPLTVRFEDDARVLTLALRARDFVASRILIALQPFKLGDQPPPAVLENGQLLELAFDLKPAVLQAPLHLVLMVAHISRIEHGGILSDITSPEAPCSSGQHATSRSQ